MAEYYKTSFTIEDAVETLDLRGVALLEAAADIAHEWAEDRFGEPLGDGAGNYVAANGTTVHIDREQLEESGFWGLTLEHPDKDTDGVRWRSDFRLATEGDRVEAEVEVRRIGGESALAYGYVNRPNALATLFQKFICKSAGQSLTTEAKRITASDAAAFVDDMIFSSERLMPLVVVSENRLGGVFANPDYLQSRLLGLAIVATYDNDAALAVREQLGDSPLGCWDGYIRVYRSRCLPSDASWQNRYWNWQNMSYILRRNEAWQLPQEIGDECLNLVIPQPGPRLYEEVSSRVRRLRYERLLERLRSVESTPSDDAEYKELLEYADDVTRQNDELRKDNDELRVQVDDLTSQLSDKESIIEQYNISWQYSKADESDSELYDEDEPPPEFDTVYDVVEYAKGSMDLLRFFSYATETAKGASYFPRPNDVHDALKALDDCAKKRITSGSLGKDVAEWLREKGIEYSPHESITAIGKYGAKRTFRDDLKKAHVKMPAHIKLGGGLGEQNQLRIHLIWGEEAESDEKKWLIGYIGRHLPTAKSPN